MNFRQAIEQLKKCGFTCEGGALENNVAFVALDMYADCHSELWLPRLDCPNCLHSPINVRKDVPGYHDFSCPKCGWTGRGSY